jgi:acylphosphatase
MTANDSLELKGIHIMVDGHVQGVGFRYFVYDFAQQKGLTGWVRNRWTGQVEILAEGPMVDLDALVEHVRRGPSRSMVTDLKYEWHTVTNLYDQFSMLPTE